MFRHTVPADISLLRSDIASFCGDAGFTVVAEDTTSLTYVSGGSGRFNPNTGLSLLYSYMFGFDGGAPANNSVWPAYRLVLKDPNGDCFLHLLFYTFNLSSTRDDVSEPTAYMDYYMSTGWGGAGGNPDDHPGLVKMSTWYSLPTSFTGLDMFAGGNPDGSLWAHLALEEKPIVYSHLGLGRLTKFLDFTGGDYVQGTLLERNSNGYLFMFHPYSIKMRSGSYTPLQNDNVFYAPDLDVPNKRDAASLYRRTTGMSTLDDFAGIERGSTSYQVATTPAASYGGGELSINLFPLPNPWSGTAPLLPIYVSAIDGNDANYSGSIGHFTGVRAINVRNFDPGDEIVLGPDVWKVYPARSKSSVVVPYWYTLDQGFAVLKSG